LANKEIKMSPDKMIISKTDKQGKIIYVNHEFLQISGFERLELLGKPHNVIRHVDMPRGVFHLLWKVLQSGGEFNGFVKNRCKDGGYYWVFATVSSSIAEDGKTLLGYFSARRKASEQGVEFFSQLYQEMKKKESGLSGKKACEASVHYLEEICAQKELSYDQLVVQYQSS